MININNKKELELIFSQNFGSPYFPILADIYMQEGDLSRAKIVCEIGLQHSPENNCGKFILSKIALAQEKPAVAEKWLKQIINHDAGNFKALRILLRLAVLLQRSPKAIKSYLNIILAHLPNDKECNDLLNTLENKSDNNTINRNISNKKKGGKHKNPSSSIQNNLDRIKNIDYKMGGSMATFSMLTILKSQKHYQQAMAVLNMLESKNIDLDRVKKEKRAIESLIKKHADKSNS